jgi:hypothetical protein
MTDEQINAAIAESCGWTDIQDSGPWHNHTLWGYPTMKPGQGGNAYQYLPNYCTDLNAMHEAEKVLTAINQPARGCSEQGAYLSWLGYCRENNTSEVYECVTATARQRAEAFLRTLGKWDATTE